LLIPQVTRVSCPPPATSEDDDGTIIAWLASMYNPRSSLQSLYNPPPLDMLVTIRSSLRSILSVQHPHMAAKSVYFFSEVMEMVLDYMVSKRERMFDITEPLVAWVGGDPLELCYKYPCSTAISCHSYSKDVWSSARPSIHSQRQSLRPTIPAQSPCSYNFVRSSSVIFCYRPWKSIVDTSAPC
jgi:hypothetical protein